MAAAALFRSVASKMARARPTHHRPHLARGLHGSAPSGLTGSLPPPACHHQRSGERFVMAGAARSLTTMLARARPSLHHQHLHKRGLHSRTSPNSFASGSTLPPDSKMDLHTALAKIRAGVAYVIIFGSLIYMWGWFLPKLDRLEGKLKALSLNYNTQAIEGLLADNATTSKASNSEAQNKQSLGKLSVGATGNGTKVDKLEEAHCYLKKLEAAIEGLQAENTELKGLHAEITMIKIALESVRSKGKGNL